MQVTSSGWPRVACIRSRAIYSFGVLLDREMGERTSATSKAVAVLLALFGALIFWILWPHITQKTRRPDRLLVPAGFEGVLLTVYNQPGFPPLPTEGEFDLHHYPPDGILVTSSEQEFGWARDEQFDLLRSIPIGIANA